jgi:hypothetical protein
VVVDAARMPSLGPAALFIVKLHFLCSIFTQLKHKIRQDWWHRFVWQLFLTWLLMLCRSIDHWLEPWKLVPSKESDNNGIVTSARLPHSLILFPLLGDDKSTKQNKFGTGVPKTNPLFG